MPTIQLLGWPNEFNTVASFYQLLDHSVGVSGNATEANAQSPWGIAGTFSRLSVTITTNDRSTSTVTMRIDGADGNLTVTIPASTTGTFEDTSNTDVISGGELVNTFLALGGTGSNFIEGPRSIDFTPASGAAHRLASGAQSNLNSVNPYFFAPIGGQQTGSFTEAHYQVACPAGTWSNLAFEMRTNSRGTATDVKSRVGGADGNQIVTVSAGTTGSFEDVTNSDTVSAGDLIGITVDNGTGGGNFRTHWIGTAFAPSGSQYLLGCAQGGGGETFTTGSPIFHPPAGWLSPGYATEATAQAPITRPATLSRVRTYVFANGATSASTVRARVNGADGNGVVTITAATTGAFEDVTNSDSLADGDDLCWEIEVGSGGTGTIQLATISGWLTIPSGGLNLAVAMHHYRQMRNA